MPNFTLIILSTGSWLKLRKKPLRTRLPGMQSSKCRLLQTVQKRFGKAWTLSDLRNFKQKGIPYYLCSYTQFLCIITLQAATFSSKISFSTCHICNLQVSRLIFLCYTVKGSNYVKSQVKVDSSLVIELLLCVLMQEYFRLIIEGLRERTKYIDIFLFFLPITQSCSVSDVLFTGGRGVSDFSVLKYN